MLAKVMAFYTRFFAVWVVLFGVLAYFFPRPFLGLDPYKQWFFALTMFGIGAVLSPGDFKRIAQRPGIVAIGIIAQFIIMPLGAFVLSRLFALPDDVAAGLVLTASTPEAMASGVICFIAGADVAYSVSLTTVSTLICPLVTPGLTWLLAGTAVKFGFWKMALDLVLIVILPLFIGFAARQYFRSKLEKIVDIFPAISATFIIFICAAVVAANREYLIAVTGPVLAADLILNVYGMAAGYGVGALFRMNIARRRALAVEVGMQNASLGTLLAMRHFGRRAAIPAAIFVFVCIVTAAIMAALWRRTPTENR